MEIHWNKMPNIDREARRVRSVEFADFDTDTADPASDAGDPRLGIQIR
jgi:hypothetical protein